MVQVSLLIEFNYRDIRVPGVLLRGRDDSRFASPRPKIRCGCASVGGIPDV